jgi:hypothetical protein
VFVLEYYFASWSYAYIKDDSGDIPILLLHLTLCLHNWFTISVGEEMSVTPDGVQWWDFMKTAVGLCVS